MTAFPLINSEAILLVLLSFHVFINEVNLFLTLTSIDVKVMVLDKSFGHYKHENL